MTVRELLERLRNTNPKATVVASDDVRDGYTFVAGSVNEKQNDERAKALDSEAWKRVFEDAIDAIISSKPGDEIYDNALASLYEAWEVKRRVEAELALLEWAITRERGDGYEPLLAKHVFQAEAARLRYVLGREGEGAAGNILRGGRA